MTHCEMTDKSEVSSQSISQLFIAILSLGLLHRFLFQLNLSAGVVLTFHILKVFTPACVLSLIPKAIPCNLSPKCKRKVTLVRLAGCWYTCLLLLDYCLLEFFVMLLVNQLWKSPLVFLIFLSYFPLFGIWASELPTTLSVLSRWISPWS